MVTPNGYFIFASGSKCKARPVEHDNLWVLKISLVIRRNFRGQTATKIWR
jgi:hypothetical protein